MRRITSIQVLLMCLVTTSLLKASTIGLKAGYGYYWGEEYGESFSYPGFALAGCVDVTVKHLVISPSLGLWTGNSDEYSVRRFDLMPTLALKYHIFSPKSTISPYLGVEPALHMVSAGWLPVLYFGLNGLLGIEMHLSDQMSVPVEMSYGRIFAEHEGAKVNTFTIMMGLAVSI